MNTVGEILFWLVLGVIGFAVGGFCGITWAEAHTFFPYCWYGLAVVWGIPLCCIGGHNMLD